MTIGWGVWQKPGSGLPLGMVLCLLALVGCVAGDEPATTGPVDVAPSEPTRTSLTTLSDVVWTTSIDPQTREPQDSVNSYAITAPVIIAAVEVGTMPAGEELTATWMIDGQDVPQAKMRVTSETEISDGWATFQFTREEGRRFPLGVLEVQITAAGGGEVNGAVDILLP